MKGPHSKNEGMETVTSMLLLLISALLIFSVLSLIDIGKNDQVSLLELRTFQARSLGEVLMRYSNNSMESPYLDNGSISIDGAALFWDGFSFQGSNNLNVIDDVHVKGVLETTPDGLSVLLLIGGQQGIGPWISGEYVTWSYVMSTGSVITLYLSLHIGSIELVGWNG